MGTRNITKIIHQGELKVCQYGQWDGYPTTALHHIVEFLKDREKVSVLLEILPKVQLMTRKAFKPYALFDSEFYKVSNLLMNYAMRDDDGNVIKHSCDLSMEEKISYVITQTGMDKSTPFRYLLETRDTGYEIMDVLTTFAAKQAVSIPLCSNEDCEDSWDIEAKYTIDLDKGIITAWWHGKEKVFSQFPSMEELEKFEKEGKR